MKLNGKSNTKVLVLGYYNNNNLGDILFEEAFKNIFPELDFKFTNYISEDLLKDFSAVFIGGGSFLNCQPQISERAFKSLQNKKIFYIGVGGETDIHPLHLELLDRAKLISLRNNFQNKFSQPTIVITPDLVYSLQSKIISASRIEKSVLFLPNCSVVPQNLDPYWTHTSWNHFKSEFSQFLDILIEDNYQIDCLPSCNNFKEKDMWAGIEIFNLMKNKNINFVYPKQISMYNLSELFSRYRSVITQRFHGIVLSQMTNTPHMVIHHHDKLHEHTKLGDYINYYEISKKKLLDNFYSLPNFKLSINYSIFNQLKDMVMENLKD